MLVETCKCFLFYYKKVLQAYATLLNCWKFLKLCRTKLRFIGSLHLNGLIHRRELVKTDRDATMDNQQPSPKIYMFYSVILGCCSQTQ